MLAAMEWMAMTLDIAQAVLGISGLETAATDVTVEARRNEMELETAMVPLLQG
jgi:hypothetical protein